jgi:hypothetical protein
VRSEKELDQGVYKLYSFVYNNPMNATATQFAQSLRDNARWFAPDGFDRAAAGRESAWTTAATLVEEQGMTVGVIAQLEAKATTAEHANDYSGYAEYNPFYAGQAKGLREVIAKIAQAIA